MSKEIKVEITFRDALVKELVDVTGAETDEQVAMFLKMMLNATLADHVSELEDAIDLEVTVIDVED